MSRRRKPEARKVLPDPKFKSELVSKFVNMVMEDGKKSVAETIVYGALDQVTEKKRIEAPAEYLQSAFDNVAPTVEVKSRRVGGATYQVPVEVRASRRTTLAMRWIIDAASKRGEQGMQNRLAGELMDAAENRGAAVKKREDTHKMAEANKAFSHFRW
ncbi:30S ribosomal protein S7 [Sinimarinibacterium sp. CAU 1509]|uniref:30S ribosomal protein S7 n=1 Tax=Sinimarinibacterium sp. CAU 1509 TaxID=2562283 RepID=UPI0010ABEB60|nr:30S ribosomal protein S7 [Sinimarinibacterium sp. CAU 1509]TJY63173.1 30S ribosomal protein S7 [Sinimarinibacterium sp. CAU 1509]